MKFKMSYEKKDTKLFLIIPVMLIIFSSSVFIVSRIDDGEWLDRGIDLTGGTSVTVYNSNISAKDIEIYLENKYGDLEVVIRYEFENEMNFEVGAQVNSTTLKTEIESISSGDVEVKEIGPTLGAVFQFQAILAVIVAFVLMSIVVFIRFLDPVATGSIILAVLLDIFFAIAMVRFIGIRLNLHVIAGLLMLIGYAVDTNILLTTRVFKRKGDLYEKMDSSFETGFLMSMTSLCSISALLLFSTSYIISEIAMVLIFGLLADFVNTWFLNAHILKWYVNTGKARVAE